MFRINVLMIKGIIKLLFYERDFVRVNSGLEFHLPNWWSKDQISSSPSTSSCTFLLDSVGFAGGNLISIYGFMVMGSSGI